LLKDDFSEPNEFVKWLLITVIFVKLR
jgi:hypothetical protein